MAMPSSLLHVDHRGAVHVLALNRPERGNRISEALASDLRDACLQADQDDDVRVVVVTGEGPAFCEGSEVSLSKGAPGDLGGMLDRHTVAKAVAGVGKPIIAAINGNAFDQGLELALACDIRVVSEAASLGFPMTLQGELPWDGGTQLLPRVAGRATALDMLLTGRCVDGGGVLRLGLAHRVCPEGGVPGGGLLARRRHRQAGADRRTVRQGGRPEGRGPCPCVGPASGGRPELPAPRHQRPR